MKKVIRKNDEIMTNLNKWEGGRLGSLSDYLAACEIGDSIYFCDDDTVSQSFSFYESEGEYLAACHEAFSDDDTDDDEYLRYLEEGVVEKNTKMETKGFLENDLAAAMVEQMSDDDKENFTREAWREGVTNNIAYGDEKYWDCDTDKILDEIKRLLKIEATK